MSQDDETETEPTEEELRHLKAMHDGIETVANEAFYEAMKHIYGAGVCPNCALQVLVSRALAEVIHMRELIKTEDLSDSVKQVLMNDDEFKVGVDGMVSFSKSIAAQIVMEKLVKAGFDGDVSLRSDMTGGRGLRH